MKIFKNVRESILSETKHNEKRKHINQIYNYVDKSGITKRVYDDEYWFGPSQLTKKIQELGYDVIQNPTSDQYHKNGYSNDGKEKSWDIMLSKDGIEVGGKIKAFAAGSVEYPFDKYDVTLTLW
jgi:hypothetical protein